MRQKASALCTRLLSSISTGCFSRTTQPLSSPLLSSPLLSFSLPYWHSPSPLQCISLSIHLLLGLSFSVFLPSLLSSPLSTSCSSSLSPAWYTCVFVLRCAEVHPLLSSLSS